MKKQALKIILWLAALTMITIGLSVLVSRIEKNLPAKKTLAISSSKTIVPAEKQVFGTGRQIIFIDIQLPPNHEFAEGAPSSAAWSAEDPSIVSFESQGGPMDFSKIDHPIPVPFVTAAGNTQVTLELNIYYCDKESKICLFDRKHVMLPIEVTKAAGTAFTRVQVAVEAKKLSS